ncbi:MAG: hypothetical protein KAR38_02860, partial [Calditrichia bacterium]|nr:hypothetical protein [Calditrichia bacterium]
MELNIGGVGNVDIAQNANLTTQNVNVFSITPILLGLRYDLLSPKLPSKFQPYFSGGAGPYWMSNVEVVSSPTEDYNTTESFHKYGAYAGGGTNLMIKDWFALNFDLRYHFVDFKVEEGYSGLEFGMGFSFMWGKKKEMFRIEGIRTVVTDIYPAYYQFYNTYPLAFITIKNTASYPIEVNVTSHIKGYSERSKESGFKRIERRESLDIPIHAIFGKRLLNSSSREPAVIDLKIEGRGGNTHTKSLSVNIMIHSRNSWNGEMDKLAFFVTPDDKDILQFSRQVEKQINTSKQNGAANFNLAKAIFKELKESGLHYLCDPNIPYYQDDRVQFA